MCCGIKLGKLAAIGARGHFARDDTREITTIRVTHHVVTHSRWLEEKARRISRRHGIGFVAHTIVNHAARVIQTKVLAGHRRLN